MKKKIFSLLIILIMGAMLITLTGCGDEDDDDSDSKSSENSAETSENTAEALTELEKVASEMSDSEIMMYNSSVTDYAGDNTKAANAKACIDEIISSNANYAGENGRFIGLTLTASGVSSSKTLQYGTITGQTLTIPWVYSNDSTTVSKAGQDMATAKFFINSGYRYSISIEYEGELVKNVIIAEIQH